MHQNIQNDKHPYSFLLVIHFHQVKFTFVFTFLQVKHSKYDFRNSYGERKNKLQKQIISVSTGTPGRSILSSYFSVFKAKLSTIYM